MLEIDERIVRISPSQFVAGELRNEGISVDYVIPNFVPDPGYPIVRDDSSSEDGAYITYLGMLEPHKGPQTLLEAFFASKNDHQFRLIMVGEGSLKTRLAKRIRELGLNDRVELPGFVSSRETERIRRHAALHVVPSEWPENAPLTALESLSFGTPILGSNEGGLPEILDRSSGSLVYESGDKDSLASKLKQVWNELNHIDVRRRMARSAYELRYHPRIHLTEYLGMISRIWPKCDD